jgi:hypothetical protein
MLTRKHFAELAKIIERARHNANIPNPYNVNRIIDDLQQDLIMFCEADNPAFDRNKFRKAGGECTD